VPIALYTEHISKVYTIMHDSGTSSWLFQKSHQDG
jgi:hypothetical protein